MKYLQLSTVLIVIGCSLIEIHSLPVEGQGHQVSVLLPDNIQADLPSSLLNPGASIVTPVPLTLLDVTDADEKSVNATQDYQRRARNLGFGLGSLGLGGKFNGLGLGFKGPVGFGGWGFGGLHGLGLGGFKPFFGNHFG